jgi:hypothetical protein
VWEWDRIEIGPLQLLGGNCDDASKRWVRSDGPNGGAELSWAGQLGQLAPWAGGFCVSLWGQLMPPIRSITPRPPFTGIIPFPTESLQRADFCPFSLSHYTSLSLLLWTAPLSAIGQLTHLSSPIPHWSAHVYLDRRLPYITCYPSTHGLVIALMMEAVRTSETSVNFNVTTWRYIPEDSKLHTRCRENPKSHKHELFVSKGRSQGTV